MLYKNIISNYSIILLGVFSTISIFLSINVGINLYDVAHPIKMFVEANQLLSGLTPYKEIFISYGYLTTALHSFSIILFGNQVLSTSIITGIFYALTFPIFFLILKNLGTEKKISILSIIVIFLIHPSIVLPWSTYFAYFFFLLGLYFLTKNNIKKKEFILTGFFWSLACFSRQTYFIPLFLLIFTIISCEFFLENSNLKKNSVRLEIMFLLIGFFLPVLLFIFVLLYNQTFKYWFYFTFDLSSFYLKPKSLESINSISFLFLHVKKSFIDFFFAKNIKSFFYLTIVIFNIYFIFFFFKKKFNKNIFYISILSLLMLSQNIHYIEVFRMSTSVVVGFITLINCFQESKILKNFIYFIIFFSFFSFVNTTYNLFKARQDFVNSDLSYLRYQKMPANVALFYSDVFKAINNIKANYTINKNFNYTHIPMLAFLSGTKSNQIGTYYDEAVENFYSNKTEFIELEKSLTNFTDIIIFTPSNDEKIIKEKFQKDFFLYKSFKSPILEHKYIHFLIHNNAKRPV